MSALGTKLRRVEGNRISFWCPGCECAHTLHIVESGDKGWRWDGNVERPTFSPSVAVRSGHYSTAYDGKHCWCTYNREHPDDPSGFECGICHLFVREGQIQFLADSTHKLSGQTVELPDFPE